jgi:hypothetical protein
MLLAPSVSGLFKWRQFEHYCVAAWFSALSMLPSDPGRRAGRILSVKDHEVLTMKCNEKAGFSELSAIFTPPSKNAHG